MSNVSGACGSAMIIFKSMPTPVYTKMQQQVKMIYTM